MLELIQRIRESAIRAGRSDYFRQWAEREKPSADELIVINNSFLHREGVHTNKAAQYLAVRVTGYPVDVDHVLVVEGVGAKAPLKKVSTKARNLKQTDLQQAVSTQLAAFGDLAFVLIGTPDGRAVNEVALAHGQFKRLIWDQGGPDGVSLDPKAGAIRVRQIVNEESIWSKVVSLAKEAAVTIDPSFRDTLAQGCRELQETATASLLLPSHGEGGQEGLTEHIASALEAQLVEYRAALDGLGEQSRSRQSQMEIYRLAYTFASDALAYLRLLISVCDLKPILLWMSIHAHLRLTAAFDDLPWAEAGRKPSLNQYRDVIADARNSAFHNALPFRTALRVDLPDGALRAPTLTFFSPYAGKRDSRNALDFQDRQLVDVLLQFTRARERILPGAFWRRNAEVIESVTHLFRSVSQALHVVHSELGAATRKGGGTAVA